MRQKIVWIVAKSSLTDPITRLEDRRRDDRHRGSRRILWRHVALALARLREIPPVSFFSAIGILR
jgi:hypothetical protein